MTANVSAALHMGGFPQQAVQAMANFPGVFNPHMMNFPGGLPLQQLGTAMGCAAPNGTIPLPALSLPAAIKVGFCCPFQRGNNGRGTPLQLCCAGPLGP